MTATCFVLFWLTRPRHVQVVALLAVSMRPGNNAQDFDIVQRTHLADLKSAALFQAALSDPQIAKLSLVSHQTDPIGWLQAELQSQFQQNSELLSISLTVSAKHSSDAQALLNAIVNAYLKLATAAEQQQWQAVLQQRQAKYDQLRSQINENSKKIAGLRHERGPEDPEASLLQIETDWQVEAAGEVKAEIVWVTALGTAPPRVRLIQPPTVTK